jgi:uncharacterized protein (DUF924 family)
LSPDSGWQSDVLDFWFGLKPEQWWTRSPDLDALVRDRFCELWKEERQLPPELFLTDARTALAGVILFDQFPRNMFRGDAEQYSTDPLAQAVARGAVDRGLDEQLDENGRIFLYMPFMHSENMDDQRRSLLLFTSLGDEQQLKYAKHHHDIVERYGRFPHRNAILGRESRPGEIASGADKPW